MRQGRIRAASPRQPFAPYGVESWSANDCHAVTIHRRAVRSDRAALRCAALGVAKAARAAHSEAGASPAERRT